MGRGVQVLGGDRGPSLDPPDRRLAVEVEDHPLDYGDFEGTIPKGQYGGGTVLLWDRGYWAPEPGMDDVDKALGKGELKFVMEGERLHGSWVLVRLKPDERSKRNNWLLIKHRDDAAEEGEGGDHRRGPLDRLGAQDGRDRRRRGQRADPFMTGRGQGAPTRSGSRATMRPRPPSALAADGQGRGSPAKPKPAAMPAFVEPQLCISLDRPPSGPGYGARDQVRRLPHAARACRAARRP